MSYSKVPLSDVVTLQRGMDLPAPQRRPGDFPVVSAGGIVGSHNEGPVRGPGVAIGRATNLGRPTWVEGDFWPLNTTLYVKDFKGNDPGFVYRLFQSIDLTGFDSGSVQAMLNRNYISQVPVPLPPLPTQRAIAEVLGALDDKIAANQLVADSADTLATALVAREESEPTQLARVAEVVMGSSPRGESMNEVGEGIEFFQGVRDFGIRVPVRRVSTTEPTRVAASGDVLLSVRAPVGRVNRADRTMCVGRGLAAVRSEYPNVLFHVLRNAPMWESFNGEGTVFGSISGRDLRGVVLAWPSQSRLAILEQSLKPIEARIDQAVAESAHLAELRDTLLPHLMSGRLTVREAEKQVEEVL